MPRLPALAAVAALFAAGIGVGAAVADPAPQEASPQPAHYLSWPGKAGAAQPASPPDKTAAVALPRQFFGGGDDMAAAPPPISPRAVPGTQAATSSANSATNRALQNEILTADSASDGPVAGAEAPN
jgi:hypothetical protein